MASRKIGKVVIKNSALFICDMQEKFRNTVKFFPQITEVAGRLLSAANALNMPVLVTEQYPKGNLIFLGGDRQFGNNLDDMGSSLGHTVPELDVVQHKVIHKTSFSMCVPEMQRELEKYKDVKSIVLCGIEAHACVQQTVFDLIENDYDVHVVVDACSSRSLVDRFPALTAIDQHWDHTGVEDLEFHAGAEGVAFPDVRKMYAFQRMREAGAHLTTSESILLGLLQDASHPKFKHIQKLIMEVAPDSGLLSGSTETTSAA